MKKIILCAAVSLSMGGCMSLPGGGTGLDPKFLDGVKAVVTDTNCGHHDDFRATVGAAGIPASVNVVATRDCPTPLATSITPELMQEAIIKGVDAYMATKYPPPK